MASFPTHPGDVSQAPGRNPAFRDPAYRDPGFRDPVFRDPGFRDPAFRDPAYRDPAFMEAINQRMRVPERLSVSSGQQWGEEERRPEHPPPAYSMHIPDRLTYTEAPDMSPRPVSTPSKPGLYRPLGPEACWERQPGDGEGDFCRENTKSPMRRSYSDQTFGRTPPASPSQTKQVLSQHSQVSPFRRPDSSSVAAVAEASPPVLVEQGRKSAMESWSPEEEGGAAVELIVLRRQVVKMTRRLAGLERQSSERRQTEVVLFSLLLSACLLNAWLWIRR